MPRLKLVTSSTAPSGPAISVEERRAMQRAIVNLFDRWGLKDEEAATLLGGIAIRTLQRWKAGEFGRVGPDLAARLSNLLGIHKALRLLFRDPVRSYGWIKRDNDAFEGQSALSVMLGGQLTDLMRVRRYLDSQRAAW